MSIKTISRCCLPLCDIVLLHLIFLYPDIFRDVSGGHLPGPREHRRGLPDHLLQPCRHCLPAPVLHSKVGYYNHDA